MEHRIGFIGLGNIGKPMAVNLLRAGYSVTVHDLRREVLDGLEKLGAKIAGSAREVGAASDIVEIAVIDDAQLQTVALGDDGALAGTAPGAILLIHSTVSPETCRAIAAQADRVAVRVVDAPVSGAEAGAIAGTLTLLVGGDADDVEACRSVFDIIGERVFHLGGIGTGQVAKICNNLMFTVNLRAALEALRLADAAGLDEKLMREITAGSTANSWSLEHIDAMREMMLNRRQSRDSIAIGNKDLSLAAGLGQSLGVDTPIAAFVSQLESWNLGRTSE
jgi:3-hydroxyisobutyrate dehydrogenase-like beta-hydroxyacid dehydrogenase